MTEEQTLNVEENTADKLSPGLNVVSFLVPIIVGILYLINKDKHPIKARAIGRAALWGLAFGLVFQILKILLSAQPTY